MQCEKNEQSIVPLVRSPAKQLGEFYQFYCDE